MPRSNDSGVSPGPALWMPTARREGREETAADSGMVTVVVGPVGSPRSGSVRAGPVGSETARPPRS